GVTLCRMFNRAIRGQLWMSKYLSSDNDPLYRFHQWQANLRVLELTEIKSIPYVPLSHPFVERLIGTLRREYLDHLLFWTTSDLEKKLLDFRTYFNNHRTHTSREGRTRDAGVTTNRKSPLVWLAAPLSILISDPNGCLTFQIFGLTEVSGQAPQKPRMKSRALCALGCSAFRDSDRFTVTRSVQKGRGISLSWRDLRVISPSYQFATDRPHPSPAPKPTRHLLVLHCS